MAEIVNNPPVVNANAGQAQQRGPRSRNNLTMSRFKSVKHAYTAGADRDLVIQEYPIDEVVQLYLPDTPMHASKVFMYCMEMLRVTVSDDWQEIQGIYASALCCIFSGLQTSVTSALRELGIGVDVVKLPSQSRQYLIELPTKSSFPTIVVMTGLLLLIPYKHVNANNYEKFAQARGSGIRSHTGCVVVSSLVYYLHREQAEIIKKGLGSLLSFKYDLLTAINSVSGGKGSVSHMCNYLLEIIAWTDMAAIVFIKETLLVTNSPVLRDPRVSSEVLNLGAAFREICKLQQPQFFRIQAAAHLHHLLNRNNFPTLHGVASSLRAEQTASVNFFVPALNRENALVKELCELHNASIGPINNAKFAEVVGFLTTYPGDEPLE